MKKVIVKIIALALSLVAVSSLFACGDTGHQHSFTVKSVSEQTLAQAATCTTAAKYYYTCECGEKGTETYEAGTPAHDYIDHICKFCSAEEVYTKGLRYAINKKTGFCTILGFEEGVFVENVIIPTKMENAPVKFIGQEAFNGVAIKSVVLPEGLEEIYTRAFQDTSITVVTIPSTVHHIYPYAFMIKGIERAVFTVTTDWVINKAYSKSPSEDTYQKPSTMASAETCAKMLRDHDERRGNGSGDFHWFRIVK